MTNVTHVRANLVRLRSLMADSSYVGKPLQAYLVPNTDAHQSQYIPQEDCRTHTISGFFAGKATSVVTSNKAVVWTSVLFHDQALNDIDRDNWTPFLNGIPSNPTVDEFLIKELPPNSRIGVNPRYISLDSWKVLNKALSISGHTLVPVSRDLVDVIREEQGIVFKSNQEKFFVLDLKYAGKSWQDKVQEVRETLKRKNVFAIVISNLDELAWLFNLRGRDIQHHFIFYGFAVITPDQISLFVDESKVTDDVRSHLNVDGNRKNEEKVEIRPYEDIKEAVMELNKLKKSVWISPDINSAIGTLMDEERTLMELIPTGRGKAVKNPVEIQGMKDCHIRDAVALCEFWSWLEREIPKGHVTEVSAATQQEEFCKQQNDFLDLSFKTHSFFGDGNPSDSSETGKTITDKGMYFNASGRHYLDGTTNISRVMHYGTPSPWHQECYTRVLKGHIDLAKTVFPTNTTGHALDAFARKALWDIGQDYLLYTGHGVGHVLLVVEGPYCIARVQNPEALTWGRTSYLSLPLQDGMFVTIEPGFYEVGEKFKFRHENMFVVRPAELQNNHRNRGFLKFEAVSFIEWLNAYHAECLSKVGPVLKEQGKKEALDWLIAETKPL
ncbi:xaa-Pro aminopeptidase 1-like isoform X2 [Actinia tenebrosa]|uniref:Xaa-Pro aminopeptidase 1-like isoform X2 n=1 Tax=Actinia tenebrosa TaxID=6105 RepID=A0A6P8I6W0_ACTTE|nr:xaa-Pro aminopeptidase 1-like isoform X2 [Actinia tenebrosa]